MNEALPYDEHTSNCPGCPICDPLARESDIWQEIECPHCRLDWDLEMPLRYAGDTIECISCGHMITIDEDNCRTASITEAGEMNELPLRRRDEGEPR